MAKKRTTKAKGAKPKPKPKAKAKAPAREKPAAKTLADREREIAEHIAQAQASADKEILAMGKLIGDEADQQLLALVKDGVQTSHGSEGGFTTPLVGAHASVLRLALQRAGRIGGEKKSTVKVEGKQGEDGTLHVIVHYDEAPHADAND
jgi:hypothetical protein